MPGTFEGPSRRRWVALAGLALVAVGAAIGGAVVRSGDNGENAPASANGGGRGAQPAERASSFLARLIPPAGERVEGRPVPHRVRDLAAGLSLEQKAAQVLLLGFPGSDADTPDELERLGLGGLVVERENYQGPERLRSLTEGAAARDGGRVAPLVMAAQEGGEFSALSGLPPELAPSELASAEEARRAGAQAGEALRAVGVTGVLAPVLDVGLEDGSGIGPRAYSDDPREVADFAQATVTAYASARVLSAPKHFPGLGSASQSTEQAPANVGLSLDALRRRDLIPFRAAIEAGAPAIVIGHGLYAFDDFVTPASLSHRVVTDLLRGELSFLGLAITDDLADPAVASSFDSAEATVSAIRAGADLLQISGPATGQRAAHAAILKAVRSGEIPLSRLNEAVLRVLDAKLRIGVLR